MSVTLAGAYRFLANVVGVLLVVLVLVAVPLNHLAHHPGLTRVVAPLHGYLYVAYVVVAFLLSRRLRLSIPTTIVVLLAGLVPFLTFVVERRVSARVRDASVASA